MTVPFSDFQKLDLRVGKIVAAECVEGSEKLVLLKVDMGDPVESDGAPGHGAGNPNTRQIVAGIGKSYTADELIGKVIVIVANLEPRKLMGLESDGMLLAASDADDNPVLLVLDREVSPGARVK